MQALHFVATISAPVIIAFLYTVAFPESLPFIPPTESWPKVLRDLSEEITTGNMSLTTSLVFIISSLLIPIAFTYLFFEGEGESESKQSTPDGDNGEKRHRVTRSQDDQGYNDFVRFLNGDTDGIKRNGSDSKDAGGVFRAAPQSSRSGVSSSAGIHTDKKAKLHSAPLGRLRKVKEKMKKATQKSMK